MTKRAIALGGGGPTLGFDVGALACFAENGVEFDVWSLSCSGAWVGVVFNTMEGSPVERAAATRERLRSVFRDAKSYAGFPVGKIFAPNAAMSFDAMLAYFNDPANLDNLSAPEQVDAFVEHAAGVMSDPERWNMGEMGRLVFEMAAADPLVRYMFSAFWRSNMTGLSQLYYPDSKWLNEIKFDNLYRSDAPVIYHNAWNLGERCIELFSNKAVDGCGRIDAKTLCACSALPFIQAPIVVREQPLCEAIVKPMSFDRVLEHHADVEEVWIVRGLHIGLTKPPRDLTDSLGNLIMLMAASLGFVGVALFRYEAKRALWGGRIVELEPSDAVTFDWTHENFDAAYRAGHDAAAHALEAA